MSRIGKSQIFFNDIMKAKKQESKNLTVNMHKRFKTSKQINHSIGEIAWQNQQTKKVAQSLSIQYLILNPLKL